MDTDRKAGYVSEGPTGAPVGTECSAELRKITWLGMRWNAFGPERLLMTFALVTWLALLVYLALLQRTPRIPPLADTPVSTLAHVVTSAALAGLLYRILAAQADNRWKRIRFALVSAGVTSAMGLGLELVQISQSSVRAFQFSDVFANVLGATLAVVVLITLADLGVRSRVLSIGTVVFVGSIAGGILASLVIWNPAYPYKGDHWHVPYLVVVCGERVAPFTGFQGGIHTHGDGVIHVHPFHSSEEGSNATLGLLISRTGGDLSAGQIALPSGETFIDGDLCPDGQPGELRVSVFDDPDDSQPSIVEKPGSYVLRDGRSILIEFGSFSEPRLSSSK